MKRFAIGLSALLVLAAFMFGIMGCTTPDAGKLVDLVSSVAFDIQDQAETLPATSTASVPVVVESQPVQAPAVSTEEIIAAGSFERPAVAVGPDGSLYVAAEGGKMQSIHLYSRSPAGKWKGGIIAKSERGGLVNSSRVYVPDIVVDRGGYVFVSMRCGPKEWGVLHGPAIYIQEPAGSGQWKFLGLTTGAARLDISGDGTVFLMSKDGAWGALNSQGGISRQGVFRAAGSTGEKFDLDIVGLRWFTAMNGYSAMPAAFASGSESAGKAATWASHARYPEQGNDLCYPSICVDTGDPARAYLSAIFGGQCVIQVMIDGAPKYAIDRLPSLGAGTLEDRCPPRLVSGAKGVVAIWRQGGNIMGANVDHVLAGKKSPVQICAGTFPAAVADASGRIRIAYVSGGALRLKTVDAF